MNSKEPQVITSTIMVDISGFEEKYTSSKMVTYFNINVYDNFSRTKWTLSKRYSEFEALYKSLCQIITNVPTIPGKSFFKLTSKDSLEKRKNHLESFLHECVNRKDIMASEAIKNFLELEKHSPKENKEKQTENEINDKKEEIKKEEEKKNEEDTINKDNKENESIENKENSNN